MRERDDVPEAAPRTRPATDSQLLRLGRHIGLGFDEAEALLELINSLPPAPSHGEGEPGSIPGQSGESGRRLQPQAAHRLVALFSPALLHRLRVVPGLFLLLDGVTLSRVERARSRVHGALHGGARLRRFLHRVEVAAGAEADLLSRVARALYARRRKRPSEPALTPQIE
jgi:hypothetical protein